MKTEQLTRMPWTFIFIPFVLFSAPLIAFHYFGMRSINFPHEIFFEGRMSPLALETYMRHYIYQSILQWSTFSLSTLVVLLAFIQYYLTRHKIVVMIGVVQILVAIYFILFPLQIMHLKFSIIYFFKLVVYFMPFLALSFYTFSTYNFIIEQQQKQKLQHKKLQYAATHDLLTGLYNQFNFINHLDNLLENNPHIHCFALFMIDIDNFKMINDSFGHAYGDALLKKFATKLTALTRQGDIFARLGGDEFGLLTLNVAHKKTATNIAKRILHGLQSNAQELQISVSIGITLYPFDGATRETLIKNADAAMYEAKKAGKNTHHFFNAAHG